MIIDPIYCTRDTSLFLLERDREESAGEQGIFHIELDRLQSRLNPDSVLYNIEDGSALQVVPWSNNGQSVKLLIVGEVMKALFLLAAHGYNQVLDFVGDRSLNGEPGLHDDALLEAAAKGWHHMVELLLNKGANVNAQGKLDETAIQVAAKNSHEKVVQTLLDNGADVNHADVSTGDGGYSLALFLAINWAHEKVVQTLLDAGVDVNAEGGKYRGTALQEASSWGHTKIMQVLLDKGANVNAAGGKYRGTALQEASRRGHREAVQLLLDAGADVNAEARELSGSAPDVTARYGHESGTAWELASKNGNHTVAQMLLDAGANVSAGKETYGTKLQVASRRVKEKVVQLTLKHGAKSR